MNIFFILFLIVFWVFAGRDSYLVWLHPDKFIEMTIKRRDKSFPSMKGEPLLFDDEFLIKWDRVLLPIIFILVSVVLVLTLGDLINNL